MSVVHVGGKSVAMGSPGDAMDPVLAPRPYLHPVRTLAGVDLTEVEPADHRHHYGVSAAIADINGTTYWGGKSYVHPGGYTLIDNQGRQRLDESVEGPGHLAQRLTWLAHDGATHLTEERTITAHPLRDAWALRWRSSLTAGAQDLLLGSPATRGRTGAGYGGLFWRVSADTIPTVATVREGDGEETVLGSTSAWLTITQQRPEGTTTLLLAQPSDNVLPWFVRTKGYVGGGPAVAWAEHQPLAAGDTLDLHLWAVLADRAISPEEAETLQHELENLA